MEDRAQSAHSGREQGGRGLAGDDLRAEKCGGCDEIFRNSERTRHEDQKRAAARGVSAGCDVMIHGIRNGGGWIGAFRRWEDWTAGCIAVTDEEVEELWRVTPDGTTIEIRP